MKWIIIILLLFSACSPTKLVERHRTTVITVQTGNGNDPVVADTLKTYNDLVTELEKRKHRETRANWITALAIIISLLIIF